MEIILATVKCMRALRAGLLEKQKKERSEYIIKAPFKEYFETFHNHPAFFLIYCH